MQVENPRVTPFYGGGESSGLFTFINRNHTSEFCYYPALSPQLHWTFDSILPT